MTSGNSRVTVIEVPNQQPELGRVSSIVDRIQNLFPDLGGVVPDSGVDVGRDLTDSFCRVRGRKLGAPHRSLSHQLPNSRSKRRVVTADVARRYGPRNRSPDNF